MLISISFSMRTRYCSWIWIYVSQTFFATYINKRVCARMSLCVASLATNLVQLGRWGFSFYFSVQQVEKTVVFVPHLEYEVQVCVRVWCTKIIIKVLVALQQNFYLIFCHLKLYELRRDRMPASHFLSNWTPPTSLSSLDFSATWTYVMLFFPRINPHVLVVFIFVRFVRINFPNYFEAFFFLGIVILCHYLESENSLLLLTGSLIPNFCIPNFISAILLPPKLQTFY